MKKIEAIIKPFKLAKKDQPAKLCAGGNLPWEDDRFSYDSYCVADQRVAMPAFTE